MESMNAIVEVEDGSIAEKVIKKALKKGHSLVEAARLATLDHDIANNEEYYIIGCEEDDSCAIFGSTRYLISYVFKKNTK